MGEEPRKFAPQHLPLPPNFIVHLVRNGEMLCCALANDEETMTESDEGDGEDATSPDSKRARHA